MSRFSPLYGHLCRLHSLAHRGLALLADTICVPHSAEDCRAGPSGFQGSAQGMEGIDESSQNNHLVPRASCTPSTAPRVRLRVTLNPTCSPQPLLQLRGRGFSPCVEHTGPALLESFLMTQRYPEPGSLSVRRTDAHVDGPLDCIHHGCVTQGTLCDRCKD